MVLIRENLGLEIRFYARGPEKARPCAEQRVWRILRQNPSIGHACINVTVAS